MIESALTTDRLQLELLRPEDHIFMHALVNTPGWIEFIGDRNVHSQEDALAYIDRILNTEHLYYWVIRTRRGTPIGVVSFLKRHYLEHFDIGFALLPDFQGYGYAYEAATGILEMVSAYPEYQPVLATILPHNVESIKVLVNLGLRFEREMEVGSEVFHIYSNS